MAAEQAYNSKMLVEEMGLSVELSRGIQGVIVGEEVKRVIKLVTERKGKGEGIGGRLLRLKNRFCQQ
jgi:hypothetical protein